MAGELKSMVERWNTMGRNIGARVTPYGSYLRARNQLGDYFTRSNKQVLEGDIVKSRFGRALGGNTLNRAMSRANDKLALEAEQQKIYSEKVKAEAEKQLETGIVKNFAQGMQKRRGLRFLGRSLEWAVDRNSLLARRVGLNRFTYSATKEDVAARKLDADQIRTSSDFESERRFVRGGDMPNDEYRYVDLLNKLRNTDLSSSEQEEITLIARKIGINSGSRTFRSAIAAGATSAQKTALIDGGASRQFLNRREAHDRVALIRRGQFAEISGTTEAQKDLRTEAESHYAIESVYATKQDGYIAKTIFDPALTGTKAQRDDLIAVLNSRRANGRHPSLDRAMQRIGIVTETDLANGAKVQALQRFVAQSQLNDAANKEIIDGINKKNEDKAGEYVAKKFDPWGTGVGAVKMGGVIPSTGAIQPKNLLAYRRYEAVLGRKAGLLDAADHKPVDISAVERELGSVMKGLNNEFARAENADMLIRFVETLDNSISREMTGRYKGAGGEDQIKRFKTAVELGNHNDIRNTLNIFRRSNLGQDILRVNNDPVSGLASIRD